MNTDLGLLLVRILLGAAIASHGAQKLFGWFGGYGIKGTGGFFEGIGFRPGVAFATAAGITETLGGILIALGLLGPIGPALILSTMIVAAVAVHIKNGFFNSGNGYEMPFVYAVAAVTFAFSGFGAYSLDALLQITAVSQPAVIWIALVLAAVGAFGNLGLRRGPAATEKAATN